MPEAGVRDLLLAALWLLVDKVFFDGFSSGSLPDRFLADLAVA